MTDTTGWIVLVFVLAVIIITLLIMIVIIGENQPQTPPDPCFGPWGLELNVDNAAINRCGSSRTEPCTFTKTSLEACINECNQLSNICSSFTFNPTTATMKIVNTEGTFTSGGTTLYVRQNGQVS